MKTPASTPSTTERILFSPIAEWPQLIASAATRNTTTRDIEADLSALIQRASLLHGYISHRFNTGCGDQGHDDGARAAQKQLVAIRKVMGFSYPKNTPLSM